jgi:hypothetical protein
MAKRRLVLVHERLTELTSDELALVAGGAPDAVTKTCPDYTYYCLTGPAICGAVTRITVP